MKRETADCLVMYVYGRIEGGRIVVRKEQKEQKGARVFFGFFPGGAPEESHRAGGGKPWVSGREGGGANVFLLSLVRRQNNKGKVFGKVKRFASALFSSLKLSRSFQKIVS